MKKMRTYSRIGIHAASLLGKQIRLHRKLKHWSENELAERAAISRATVQKIEKGGLTCQLGLVFEVATLVGVPLFDPSLEDVSARGSKNLVEKIDNTTAQLALLPKTIHKPRKEVDDAF